MLVGFWLETLDLIHYLKPSPLIVIPWKTLKQLKIYAICRLGARYMTA
jgi:hypothetical protein